LTVARRRNTQRRPILVILVLLVLVGITWWVWTNRETQQTGLTQTQSEPIGTEVIQPATPPQMPDAKPVPQVPSPDAQSVRQALASLEQGDRALGRGDLITARTAFNEALATALPAEEARPARGKLIDLADKTVFSSRRVPGDPLTDRYVIEPGQTLSKIAEQFKVTDDLLAKINDISNKQKIRAGQTLKIVHGPFHAIVDKSELHIYVYLQDVLVRSFPVGLGIDDGTPTGQWRIKDKLVNPTYYPPRGGKIIQADEPENPLGERWLGLEGISGQAKGQLRYGIHGTIEAESIGKNVSMGCIRLHNPDVELLFDLLVLKDSTVTVRD
jgi:lipoprotein-anchoring transpeptidase ErfK/SrfK